MDLVLNHPYLIPLLPLVGAVVAGFFGARHLRGRSHWPIWLGVGASALLSLVLLLGAAGADQPLRHGYTWFTWIKIGGAADLAGPSHHAFEIAYGFFLDPLTAVMLAVVCGIGFVITVFAAGYMKGEEGYFRFFAYLGLFIFMMTNLVMGENLIMLYLGWEGVGLCSYLLIGYYYDKPAAREAAKKAFIVNRVGDFGFALGIMLCFAAFGTVSYFGDVATAGDGMLERAAAAAQKLADTDPANDALVTYWERAAITWAPFLLMLGAFGKSAQFPLYVWLPDAMEGPTPVSALIHAATMVTAGVYMIARCGALFAGNAAALTTIAVVGAFTALFAGTIALRQFDLKKVFAYSTVSQLGFMFVGVAVLSPVAAVFHLVTHAFFKALLFLSSGVVMHAMDGVLDMRQMSGLKRVLPKTNLLMLVGCFALAGMVPFSGFFSKDEIIHAAYHGGPTRFVLGTVLLFTAFLTAYYTFRLYFRVFQGPLRLPGDLPHGMGGHATAGGHGAGGHATASASAVHAGDTHESGVDEHLASNAHRAAVGDAQHGHGASDHDNHGHAGHGHHNHEPAIMIVPLVVLAVGALLAGFLNWPGHNLGHFLGGSESLRLGHEVAAARFGSHADPTGFGQPTPRGEEHGAFNFVMAVSVAVSALGIFAAYVLHLRDRMRAERMAAGAPGLTRLLEAKYWVDELYHAAIVTPLHGLGRLLWFGDRYIIDGAVAAVSWVPQLGGWVLKLGVQRGSLQGYAAAMLFGVVVILVLVFL